MPPYHTNTKTHIQPIVQYSTDTSFLCQSCTVYALVHKHTHVHIRFTPYTYKHSLSGTLVIMDVHMLNHSDNYSCVSLSVCQSVHVYVCGSVLFAALSVFLLVVEVILKECSGKGGLSRPLNQQGRASNESVALTRADAN